MVESKIKRKWAIFLRVLPWLQGTYYFGMGLWPLLSISTFMRATGPKTDIWLVKTIGLLLVVAGVTLIISAVRKRMPTEIILFGIGYALVLAGIAFVYVINGTISAIYLLDAVIEILFLSGWIFRFSLKETTSAPTSQP